MLIYSTKKLLMAFFFTHLSRLDTVLCVCFARLLRRGVAALENSRRRREFLGRGESLGASSPGNFWNLEARKWYFQHSQWDISLKTSTWIRCKMTGTASALTTFTLYLKINSAGQAKWECDLWPSEGHFSSSNQHWSDAGWPISRLTDWALACRRVPSLRP